MSIDGKLKALNHYARILTLESLVHGWELFFAGDLSPTKDEILANIRSESDHGVDEGSDRPFRCRLYQNSFMGSPAWRHSLNDLNAMVDAWLVHDCYGPVREILALLAGVVPTRGDEWHIDGNLSDTQPLSQPDVYVYQVRVQVWGNYSHPKGGHDVKPGRPTTSGARIRGVYKSAEEANEVAQRTVAVTFGPRSYAKRWNENLRDDGTTRIRAVYVDSAHNTKVIAWVEKRRTRVEGSQR